MGPTECKVPGYFALGMRLELPPRLLQPWSAEITDTGSDLVMDPISSFYRGVAYMNRRQPEKHICKVAAIQTVSDYMKCGFLWQENHVAEPVADHEKDSTGKKLYCHGFHGPVDTAVKAIDVPEFLQMSHDAQWIQSLLVPELVRNIAHNSKRTHSVELLKESGDVYMKVEILVGNTIPYAKWVDYLSELRVMFQPHILDDDDEGKGASVLRVTREDLFLEKPDRPNFVQFRLTDQSAALDIFKRWEARDETKNFIHAMSRYDLVSARQSTFCATDSSESLQCS